MALAINHDQYKLKLMVFYRIFDQEEDLNSYVILSNNAYTSEEAYELYTRKEYFLADLIDDQKRWSYASGYIFGRIARTKPLALNERQIMKGISDGMKTTSPNYSFNKLRNILTEFVGPTENLKLLKGKNTYYKRLAYAMGYLYGTQIKMNNYPVEVSSSAKGIVHGSSMDKPQFGIKVHQQKNWAVKKFFAENSMFVNREK